MNPESENFEQLRRLLALKRHEVPPPGYFDRFSRDVIARIKAGERGSEGLAEKFPWLGRILAAFDTRPAIAGAFGAAVCALLVTAIVSSEGTAVSTSISPGIAAANSGNPSLTADATLANANVSASQEMSSTTSSNSSIASLFDQFQLKTQPASFSFPGGN